MAGTVSEEDKALYTLAKRKKPVPQVELEAFATEAKDDILLEVLRADAAGHQWILEVQDHIKNLPPDPEQVSCP